MFFKLMATFLKIVFFDFEEMLHLIGRCLVCCRDCLCNVFLPSRSIVLSTLMHTYMLEKTPIDRNRNEEIYFQEKWLSAKECYLLKRNIYSFGLRNATPFE